MKLNPTGGENPFEFCLRQKIVGFGWGVDGSPKNIEEYKNLLSKQKLYLEENANRAASTFAKVNKGDIIWTFDKNGEYYICRINGDYAYSNKPEYKKAHIVNYKSCSVFYKIGSGNLVPNAIIHSLGVCGVIQIVKNDKAIELSELLIHYAEKLEKEKEA